VGFSERSPNKAARKCVRRGGALLLRGVFNLEMKEAIFARRWIQRRLDMASNSASVKILISFRDVMTTHGELVTTFPRPFSSMKLTPLVRIESKAAWAHFRAVTFTGPFVPAIPRLNAIQIESGALTNFCET
jgi:hypothetical protein